MPASLHKIYYTKMRERESERGQKVLGEGLGITFSVVSSTKTRYRLTTLHTETLLLYLIDYKFVFTSIVILITCFCIAVINILLWLLVAYLIKRKVMK